jgi:hypothetical protein
MKSKLSRKKTAYLFDIVQSVYFGRQAAVHAQKLLIHERSEWQTVKRFHACVVDFLAVFDFAFLFECKIFGEMTTLVIAAQQEERW